MRSVDDSYNEEVESNAMGLLNGNGNGGGGPTITADYDTAADGSMFVHNNNTNNEEQQQEQQRQQQQGGASAGVPPPLLTTTQSARPPLPVPRSHNPQQQQGVADAVVGIPVAEVVLVEGTTPASNGGSGSNGRRGGVSNGGSNRASLTVAVVPTISENPSALQVPDISAPVTRTQGGDDDADGQQEEGGLQGTAAEDDRQGGDDGRRRRSASPPSALCGKAEGTTGGDDHHNGMDDSENADGCSEDDPIWPPDAKRQRQGSS
jgi:hypothetical protein